MIERRFLIVTDAENMVEIEMNKTHFQFISDFEDGEVYVDLTSTRSDMYYIEPAILSDSEYCKYKELKERYTSVKRNWKGEIEDDD